MKRLKVYIATPSRDFAVCAHASQSVIHLMNDPSRDFEVVYDPRQYDEDVVVVRARYVRQFLESKCDVLAFLDADVAFAPIAMLGMLGAVSLGHGFVLTPYRKKRIEWEQVAVRVNGASNRAVTARELETWSESYPFILPASGTPYDEPSRTFPVVSCGLGLSVITREVLTTMANHYRPTLEQDDYVDGQWHPTVSLFRHATEHVVRHAGAQRRPFVSEDTSFCHRYTALGATYPRLYVGPGSPAVHAGPHLFIGHPEAFQR